MPDVISTPSHFGSPAWELKYGGQRLYPSPLIEFSRAINRNENDVALSQEDTWSLHGVYLNDPSGCYSDVVTNMENLKRIFATDGLELTIAAGVANSHLPSGTLIVSGVYPHITSINIPESNEQFHKFEYTVTLVAKTAASGVSGVVQSSQDNWSFEENAEYGVTTVNHNVSAVGINTATSGSPSNALINAKAFVLSRLGSSHVPSGCPIYVVPGSGSNIFEYQRSRTESVEAEGGSYEVTEIFTYVSGTLPYADSRTYGYEKDSEGITTITVQGTIQGYPRSDGTAVPYGAFYNAQSGFLNTIRGLIPTDASGIYSVYGGSGTLSVNNPQGISLTENRFLGTFAYSYTFTDNPREVLPSGIVEQTLSIQRKDSIRLMVSHAIPFRRLGNVLQDIATPTPGTITIAASAKSANTGDVIADVNRAISYVQDLINQNRPNPAEFISLRLTDVSQDHNKLELTAQANVVWEFVIDLAQVNNPNSDIILFPISP